MREMRLVCPIFSAQIAFSGNQALIDFPSFPCPHAPFPLFPLYSPEKKKERGGGEFEVLKLLPPPFYGRNSSLKKRGGRGLRLHENKEPYHHGVWILAQTWGPGGRAQSLGGPFRFRIQAAGRMEEEDCGGQRTQDLSYLGKKGIWGMERPQTGRGGSWGGYGRDFHTFRGNSQWVTKDDTGGEGKKSD